MGNLSALPLGLILLLFGSASLALIFAFLRAVPQITTPERALPPDFNPYEITHVPLPIRAQGHNQGVVLILPGGKVAYANQQAREWFDLRDASLNLELLARRTQPSETFLTLCAMEGQARFSINGRLVEGASYQIPFESESALLVSFQIPQLIKSKALSVDGKAEPGEDAAGSSKRHLDIFTQLSQAMASNLDLEETLSAILESVGLLLPAEFAEICIWNKTERHLVPYHFFGQPGSAHQLVESAVRYRSGEGYSGYLVTHRHPLLLEDIENPPAGFELIEHPELPFRAYLGVPLTVGSELIGTLELGKVNAHGFTRADLDLLSLLSGQAAIALHNALLHEEEQRKATELAGLAELAQAVSALPDTQDLFTRLSQGIQPLINVEMLGFLLYDEVQRTLKAQSPFQGIPDDFLALYQGEIAPGSAAEAIWLSQKTIHAANAVEDDRVQALGFEHLARAAGMLQTVFVPLSTSGRQLGYLQAANKRNGKPFDADDLRLLAIIAGQIAPIIENSALVHLSKRRALRAEALRRVASLASSSATLDEILKYSLQEFARLVQADMAAIFLLDENHGELRLHKDSLFGLAVEVGERLGRLSLDDPQFEHSVTGSRQSFHTDNASEDSRILPLYRPIVEGLNIQSAIDVPLIVRERGIGEIMLGSRQPGFFSPSDAAVIASAAGQLTGAIERASLSSQTDESLRRRIDQLTALNRVSRELNATLDLERLMKRVYNEALSATAADCGSIILFEPDNGTKDKGNLLFQLGDEHNADFHPLERAVLETGEPILISDFEDQVHLQQLFEQIDTQAEIVSPAAHPGIRSGLIVPIAYQEHIAGLIHLHARAPGYFDRISLEIAQAMAVQAAIALGNTQRFQEQIKRSELLNRRVETLANLLDVSQSLQIDQPLEVSLEAIAYGIQESTPFNIALLSVYNQETDMLQRTVSAGLTLQEMDALRAAPQPWESVLQVLDDNHRLGQGYFIPHEKMPELPIGLQTRSPVSRDRRDSGGEAWHPGDMLLVPLTSSTEEILGLIGVADPRDGLQPDLATVQSLELFASQAALTIQGHQKLAEVQSQVAYFQEDARGLVDGPADAPVPVPLLARKDLEQSQKLQQLSQRARRIKAVLDIAELLNRQENQTDIFRVIGREFIEQLDFDLVLISVPGSGGPQLLECFGEVPADLNLKALLGQRNPLQHSLATGETLLIADLKEAEGWRNTPFLKSLRTAAFLSLPVFSGDEPAAALLAIDHEPQKESALEEQQLYALLARQVSIALQNLNLLQETQRRLREVNLLLEFSQISSLEPDQILQTLVESARKALPAADAGMVLLWDAQVEGLIARSAAGYVDAQRLKSIVFPLEDCPPGRVYQRGEPSRLAEVEFSKEYNLTAEGLVGYRDATGGQLPISSLIIPITATKHTAGERSVEPLGVLVLDNFKTAEAFSEDNQALIVSLAQQTALTLENVNLYQASEKRAGQLQALTSVAALITSSLRRDDLISSLLDQLRAILPYETGTLWLRRDNNLVVHAARGFEDPEERVGLSVAVEDSRLFNDMILTGSPLYVPDVREDSRFTALIEPEHLSWLGVPMLFKGEVVGAIALEKSEAEYYSTEEIQLVTTFASQSAVALENASLYQESLHRAHELDQRSRRLALLNRFSTALGGTLEIDAIIRMTGEEINKAIGSACTSFISWGDKSGFEKLDTGALQDQQTPALLAEVPKRDAGAAAELPAIPLFNRLRQSMGVFYSEEVSEETELAPLHDFLSLRGTRSLMILPMSASDTLHGFLLVHANRPRHFTSGEVELVRTITNQAAIAIESARLFAKTRRLSEDLELRVSERTAQLEREHRRTSTLLRIITEISASLDLDHVLSRTLEVLNEVIDAEQIVCLVSRPDEQEPRHIVSISAPDMKPIPTTAAVLDAERGLAGWVITNRESILLDNVLQDDHWSAVVEPSSTYRSALGVPLLVGEDLLGSLLLFHHEVARFSEDQLDLVQAAAKQIGMAINNTELFKLIRDQAEDLGTMLRNQQVETSRSHAILEAVAEGVLVTDARNKITLFNASAEQILGLQSTQVLGRSLEHFIGLFGAAAQSWIDTIRSWTHRPDSYLTGETYSEAITLENDRVVTVNLAPVFSREEFLGTVSIFHDITHQVEVDRIKAEFVANVSHELRTPMTSIKGYVDVLLMGAAGELGEQQARFLEIVKNNTDRLTILVNDLLDISRIEAGRIKLTMQPVEMHDIVGELFSGLRLRAQKQAKPLEFIVELPSDLPRVFGDPERVRQILSNLLENAYHYNLEDGTITLRARSHQGFVQVDVIDTGIGIHPDDKERVFERFFRGEHPTVMATSGTGLGLSIVQNLIQLHGGSIWVESSGVPGKGSTFSFTLPIYEPES